MHQKAAFTKRFLFRFRLIVFSPGNASKNAALLFDSSNSKGVKVVKDEAESWCKLLLEISPLEGSDDSL